MRVKKKLRGMKHFLWKSFIILYFQEHLSRRKNLISWTEKEASCESRKNKSWKFSYYSISCSISCIYICFWKTVGHIVVGEKKDEKKNYKLTHFMELKASLCRMMWRLFWFSSSEKDFSLLPISVENKKPLIFWHY